MLHLSIAVAIEPSVISPRAHDPIPEIKPSNYENGHGYIDSAVNANKKYMYIYTVWDRKRFSLPFHMFSVGVKILYPTGSGYTQRVAAIIKYVNVSHQYIKIEHGISRDTYIAYTKTGIHTFARMRA